jgi:hypothetical protein
MANGTIAFDTLQTSGQITGTAKSVDTDYVVNGSAKSWCQGSGDASVQLSLNITSGTDNGTGDYTYTYTNNMRTTTSAICATSNTSGARIGTYSAATSSSYDTDHHTDAGSDVDTGHATQTFGDLA